MSSTSCSDVCVSGLLFASLWHSLLAWGKSLAGETALRHLRVLNLVCPNFLAWKTWLSSTDYVLPTLLGFGNYVCTWVSWVFVQFYWLIWITHLLETSAKPPFPQGILHTKYWHPYIMDSSPIQHNVREEWLWDKFCFLESCYFPTNIIFGLKATKSQQ